MTSDILFDEEIEVIGNVRLKPTRNRSQTLRLHTEGGNIFAGGDGAEGDLVLRDGGSTDRIHLDASSGNPTDREHLRIYLDGKEGNITLGADGRDGDLRLRDGEDIVRVHVDTGDPLAVDREHTRVYVDGKEGNITLGADDRDGDLRLQDGENTVRVHIDTGDPLSVDREHTRVYIDGKQGTITLGADEQAGEIVLNDSEAEETIRLNGEGGEISLPIGPDGDRVRLGEKIRELEQTIADREATIAELAGTNDAQEEALTVLSERVDRLEATDPTGSEVT